MTILRRPETHDNASDQQPTNLQFNPAMLDVSRRYPIESDQTRSRSNEAAMQSPGDPRKNLKKPERDFSMISSKTLEIVAREPAKKGSPENLKLLHDRSRDDPQMPPTSLSSHS